MPRHRPPPGYRQMDHPLFHQFRYDFDISAKSEVGNTTIMTLVKATKGSADPKTIEVNPKNAAFAVDAGAVHCFDSIADKLTFSMDLTLNNRAFQTDQVSALRVNYMFIYGAYAEAWTPEDELTTETIQEILDITSDNTNEDVIPTFSGTKMNNPSNQPLSTVTDAEAFVADYGLTTDATMESTAFDLQNYWNAQTYFTNAGALRARTGKMNSIILTRSQPHRKVFIRSFVPKSIRRINPHTYFACLVHCEVDGSQLTRAADLSAGGHVKCTTYVNSLEWNSEFDQSRMAA